MPYIPFDETKPDPATQAIGPLSTSIRDNQQAIVDGILYGSMKDWDGAATIGGGSAAKPDYWKMNNGSEYLKITPTWHGSLPRIESALIQWSDDDATYHDIGTITITWSGNYYASHAWS